MIYIFWNTRGLANSPTKLVLKKLILKHKPSFMFLVEPWIQTQIPNDYGQLYLAPW